MIGLSLKDAMSLMIFSVNAPVIAATPSHSGQKTDTVNQASFFFITTSWQWNYFFKWGAVFYKAFSGIQTKLFYYYCVFRGSITNNSIENRTICTFSYFLLLPLHTESLNRHHSGVSIQRSCNFIIILMNQIKRAEWVSWFVGNYRVVMVPSKVVKKKNHLE